MADAWNCHEHRNELEISKYCSVYHEEKGVLGWWEVSYTYCIFHPIVFKNYGMANKWITNGTIAELQENLGVLPVGFSKVTFKHHGGD